MRASGQGIKLSDQTNTFNPHFLAVLKRLEVEISVAWAEMRTNIRSAAFAACALRADGGREGGGEGGVPGLKIEIIMAGDEI